MTYEMKEHAIDINLVKEFYEEEPQKTCIEILKFTTFEHSGIIVNNKILSQNLKNLKRSKIKGK